VSNGKRTYDLTEEQIEKLMTPELAAFIKDARIIQGASWRGVGARVHEAYPKLGIKPITWDPATRWVSQITGKALCDAAMNFLKEQEKDGWN
jgi:hypothetical protein